jgi:iron complex outermembrane receptor protein
MNYRSMLLTGVAATLAVSFGGLASAADAPAASAAANQGTTIGEVVVTATRREESLQKVPVAITAFSQQALTEKSISNVWDLNSAVPGLTVQADSGSGNRANFAIRGRGQNYGAAAGSVETYFADVPLSPPYEMPGPAAPFFDLQSVQVLKGPQGTLFGRSTTGGAVLFVPQAPNDQFGGYARVQGGDYGDVQLEGAVNIPLDGDKADLRLAGFFWNRDGYSHTVAGNTDAFGNVLPSQSFNNQDDQDFRATLLLRPNDRLTNSTIFAFDSNNTRATPKATIVSPYGFLSFVGAAYPKLLTYGPYTADIGVNLDHGANTSYEVINTTTYDLTSNLQLKNIFGFIDAGGYTNSGADTDGTPYAGIDLEVPPRKSYNYQYTDEVQLQGTNFNDRFSWLVGGSVDATREPGGNNIDPYTVDAGFGTFSTTWEQNTDTAYGVYGSGTFKITDALSVTAGERHSWDNIALLSITGVPPSVAAYEANANLTPGGAVAAGWGAPLITNTRGAFQGDTYNISVQDQLTSKAMLYGGYRRGFKPGGFNPRAPAGENSFAPETDDDFYAGVKTNFSIGDMHGRFNIEGYWDLYHGKQVSNLVQVPVLGVPTLETITTNVPAVTYRGIDADMTLDVTHWLRIDANYSYIDAYNTKWPDTSLAANDPSNLHLNLGVNPVAFVSPNKVSVTARFHTELPDNRGEIAFAPTVSYEDKWYVFDNAFLLPQGTTSGLGLPTDLNYNKLGAGYVPSYTMVNFRFEWNRVMGSRIDAAVNVTNVTNQVVSLGPTATLDFGTQASDYGPPRMFTFELSTKF